MTLEQHLQALTARAIRELYSKDFPEAQIQVQETRKEFEGDYTVVVFPLLRLSGKGPEPTAQELGEWLKNNEASVRNFSVIKGFLNLSLSDEYWVEQLKAALDHPNFGPAEPSGKTIMLEYSSPNTNKPLHLGHIRNNLLGYSVAKILEANGHQVLKVNLINDRGIHICKSMVAWQKRGNGETPEASGQKGDHLVGKYYVEFDRMYKAEIAELMQAGKTEDEAKEEAPLMQEAREMLRQWEAKDPEVYQLWETMNGWVYKGFEQTYRALGVDFDRFYYESETYILGKELVQEGLKKGVLYQKDDGSVWCPLEADKLKDKLLLRSDGTSVYMTQDLGTAIERFREYPQLNQLIYTVGDEQNHHFKVLFLILGKLGYDWAKECQHLSYGMVDLPSGKMKSREGTVVDADDLMVEVTDAAEGEAMSHERFAEIDEAARPELFRMLGLGALKYHILKVDPKRRIMFNPAESVSLQGDTGPFIQYGYARTQALARRAGNLGEWIPGAGLTLQPTERDLIRTISRFPAVILEAGANHDPALIASYALEVVKAYNRFYHEVRIFHEEVSDEEFALRIRLSGLTGTVVKKAMGLLGIEVPQQM